MSYPLIITVLVLNAVSLAINFSIVSDRIKDGRNYVGNALAMFGNCIAVSVLTFAIILDLNR